MVPQSLHRLWLTVILLTTLSMVLSSLSPFVAADPLRGDETGTSLEQPRDSNATPDGSAPGASGEGQAGGSGLSEDEPSGGGTGTVQEECLAEVREKIGDVQGGGVACDPRGGEATEEGSGDSGSAENGTPPAGDVTCDPGRQVDCPPGNPPGDEPPKGDKPCEENQKEGCPPKEPPKGDEPCDPGEKVDCPPVEEQPPKEDSGPGNTGLTNRDTGFPVYVSKAWVDENGSPLDPAEMPATTIVVTIDGTDYTFDCLPGGVNPVDCGSVVLPSRPTSISVTEPDLGDEWVPVVPDVSECLSYSAEECRIEITNWQNGPYTIRVWKYWFDLFWNPVSTNQISSTTITVWLDGQAYYLACVGNSNPDPCGEISLDRWPRSSIVVDEPSVPSGWEVAYGTGENLITYCTSLGNPCDLVVVNRQEGMLLYAAKAWFSGLPGSLMPGPQTYVQVTVDGFPLVVTCPATAIGWTFCGPLAIRGRPTTIVADEPWLPAGWAYYSGAGDYSSSCAGQDYCAITLINVRDDDRTEGSSPQGLHVLDVRKEWLSDGQHTSDHPSTSLELTIEQDGQSVTLLLSCAAYQPSPQSCGTVTLTQRPDRVVVREPGVPGDWQAVTETVTVYNCNQEGRCVVTFTNERNTGSSGGGGSGGSGGGGSGGSGGGGGGTGSGGEDEPVVEEPPPPGTPENPTQGGGSGDPNQGVGQQPPAQQPAERGEAATHQGQDWSIEDERLSEALRERKKIESEEQVVQLLPRTGRGGGTTWPASAVGLLVIATLLTGLALVWGSRARYRTAVGGAGERGAAGGAGRSGSDPARPPLGGRHWSARGRGRPPVR
jgi:hypothetical protein